MSEVVPPGGERPLDDEPWPTTSASPAPERRLPAVPDEVPPEMAPPPDWRRMVDQVAEVPPGYLAPGAKSALSALSAIRRDDWGLAACIVGALGIAQLALTLAPFVSVLALALALSGRRAARLDPDAVRSQILSSIGLIAGAAGVVLGIALVLRGGSFAGVIQL